MIIVLGNQKFESSSEEDRKREAVREELDRLVDFILKNEVGERLKEDDFIDSFSKEEIDRDKEVVQSIKSRLAEEADHLEPDVREEQRLIRKRSEALEIIIGDQVELNGWFGMEASLVRLAEYDDYVSGADVVVEFDMGGDTPERFAIAIDASFGTQGDTLERKIKRNLRKVLGIKDRKGELTKPAEIKYFRSEIDDHKGKLEMVVPVVVGIDKRHCNQVMGAFADIIKLKDTKGRKETKEDGDERRKKVKEKIKRMAEHPVQLVFIQEVILQLQMYLRLLSEAAPDRQELYTQKTKTLLEIFKEISEAKKDISSEATVDDRVFSKIKEITEGQRTSRSFNPK